MKHPILYRTAFYSIVVSLCGVVFYLLSLMNEAPFRSIDMQDAYRHGCNFGSRPLTQEKIQKCNEISDLFKETLDDLDKQMEELNENVH